MGIVWSAERFAEAKVIEAPPRTQGWTFDFNEFGLSPTACWIPRRLHQSDLANKRIVGHDMVWHQCEHHNVIVSWEELSVAYKEIPLFKSEHIMGTGPEPFTLEHLRKTQELLRQGDNWSWWMNSI